VITRRRRRWVGAAAAAAAAVILTGCRAPLDAAQPGATAPHDPAGTHSPAPARPTPATEAAAVAAGQVSLIQEPDAGYGPIYAAITGAHASIDMTMYELADPAGQADLIAAGRRGVTVRVILDRAFHGQQVNQDAYTQLRAAGVAVHWGPTGQLIHQKTITIDGSRSLIGTANLTSRYYASTRDAWILTTNPAQVKAIAGTFAADWASPKHSGNAVGATGLMWSPGAQQQIVADIGAAGKTLEFTSAELADTRVIAALVAAARRGVVCRIVMTDSPDWTAGFDQVSARPAAPCTSSPTAAKRCTSTKRSS